jgi:UDP-N-acetylmuramate: L-alanyl-gamma-D-glutamyl-meso-diaminopimelate ligase
MLGEHNRNNAVAAMAAAHHAGVAPEDAALALGQFRNVRRRLELRGEARGVRVYDDFAHHPTAIAATLEALGEQPAEAGRVIAVLEPRSNTMKLGVMKDQLAPSLARADRVFCYTEGLGWDAREVLAPLGARVRCESTLEALVEAVAAEARGGDRVLVMSNGGFGGIHEKLLRRIEGRT